jgi:hypothetical protein
LFGSLAVCTVAMDVEPFVGIVIGSLRPDLAHWLVGLPPLLLDAEVLAFGLGDASEGFVGIIDTAPLPVGTELSLQGVTLGDFGLLSSAPVSFHTQSVGEVAK